MVVIRVKEARSLGDAELDTKRGELEAELSREAGAIAAGTKAENPGKVRALRRAIARIATVKRERELGININNANQSKKEQGV